MIMSSTISKKAPKSLVFRIPFRGKRGGKYSAKYRLKLIAGAGKEKEGCRSLLCDLQGTFKEV